MADKYYYGKGKRKTSTAKVRLYESGNGDMRINNKSLDEYITVKDYHEEILAPLRLTNTAKNFTISVLVNGGGVHSQALAICHGISRALLEFDPELRPTLKKDGFLTRDSRKKERNKPGLAGARRAKQFSKR